MRSLDFLKYANETEEMLQKLMLADPKRKGYYQDLSKCDSYRPFYCQPANPQIFEKFDFYKNKPLHSTE